MDANRTSPRYQLKNDLAQFCLPCAHREPNLKLAWVNSICLLFLIVGIFGARRGMISILPVPPIEQIIPVVIEPMTLPPQEVEKKADNEEDKKDSPQMVVAIPESPNVSFSVPTIGALVAPASLASAPPLEPMRAAMTIGSLNNTGSGGDRPQPPYPKIALEEGEQGTVVLTLGADAAGNITSIDVKESSGFPILDHATIDYIKRHWHLPGSAGNQLFQTSITYRLRLN